jgi:hypothetical protein
MPQKREPRSSKTRRSLRHQGLPNEESIALQLVKTTAD